MSCLTPPKLVVRQAPRIRRTLYYSQAPDCLRQSRGARRRPGGRRRPMAGAASDATRSGTHRPTRPRQARSARATILDRSPSRQPARGQPGLVAGPVGIPGRVLGRGGARGAGPRQPVRMSVLAIPISAATRGSAVEPQRSRQGRTDRPEVPPSGRGCQPDTPGAGR